MVFGNEIPTYTIHFHYDKLRKILSIILKCPDIKNIIIIRVLRDRRSTSRMKTGIHEKHQEFTLQCSP